MAKGEESLIIGLKSGANEDNEKMVTKKQKLDDKNN